MDSTTSTLSGWFGTFKDKVSGIYNNAKSKVTSLTTSSSTPLQTTTATATTAGGSKKRRSKKTKRVRFSKRRSVYKYKTMRRK